MQTSFDLMLITPRLRLFPLTCEQLEWMLTDRSALEVQLGIILGNVGQELIERRAITMKLERMRREDVCQHPWSTYWLIVLSEGSPPYRAAGMAGFKGAPNDDGQVEIGYGMDASLRNRGLMTEAAGVLVDWALSQPGCQAVTASGVLKENTSSNRVLEKLGFRVQAEDPESRQWILEE